MRFETGSKVIDGSVSELLAKLTRMRQLIPEENEQRYSHGGVWTTLSSSTCLPGGAATMKVCGDS